MLLDDFSPADLFSRLRITDRQFLYSNTSRLRRPFLFSYRRNKHRLVNGLLFNLFVLAFGGYLVINLYRTQDILVGGLLAVLLAIFLAVLLFGLAILVVFLYWNSIIVLRRESRSIANLLTLILAVVLTVLLFSDPLLHFFPDWIRTLFGVVPLSLMYLFVVFLNFLSISVIYQFNHPRYNQDFIIVLGAGLLNGTTVSPLLAKRINKAISFYEAQFKAKKTAPRLLMSGGQGSDEKLPEAVAMKEYAVAQGVPEGEILVETNSTTTYENMKFSKEIMDSLKPNGYKVIFPPTITIFFVPVSMQIKHNLKQMVSEHLPPFTIYPMPSYENS